MHFRCDIYSVGLGLGLEWGSGHSFHAYASSMIVFSSHVVGFCILFCILALLLGPWLNTIDTPGWYWGKFIILSTDNIVSSWLTLLSYSRWILPEASELRSPASSTSTALQLQLHFTSLYLFPCHSFDSVLHIYYLSFSMEVVFPFPSTPPWSFLSKVAHSFLHPHPLTLLSARQTARRHDGRRSRGHRSCFTGHWSRREYL